MITAMHQLGEENVEEMIRFTSDPFTALFIGLLATAILQSSSTTTAMTVAVVAAGSVSLESAIPIIMGANVGTTITSMIVSLGFLGKKKEFRRAVSAGTYHCFFNVIAVIVLFPLEYYYAFLSSSSAMHSYFVPADFAAAPQDAITTPSMYSESSFLSQHPVVSIVVSFLLLFASILLFRKLIAGLLLAGSPDGFRRFFFRNSFQSFVWGLLVTAAIRSSTITTSVVVPIAAEKIASLRRVAAFIVGANLGTTVTALIAAVMYVDSPDAVSIALAHFLFNLIGALLFFPAHPGGEIVLFSARKFGRLTQRYRLALPVFIVITFVLIPFSLIYLNRQ